MNHRLPLGKLPARLLAQLLDQAPVEDPRVVLGPGIGLDCAIVRGRDSLLVFKSDPITFTSDEIGWYAVQVNANDIATTGAEPRWLLATLLLPESGATPAMAESIFMQIQRACEEFGITIIGGHTEITYGIDRPIVSITMIGEVDHDELITPRGASPGDHLLLTKGVPIEATAILAREFPSRLTGVLTAEEQVAAENFLYRPGISVVKDARVATEAGEVTAMHDPTEGGLAAALWELAEASGLELHVDTGVVHIPPLSGKICRAFDLDPLASIASGALLIMVSPQDTHVVAQALAANDIPWSRIGEAHAGSPVVLQKSPHGLESLPRPERDEITRVFEN